MNDEKDQDTVDAEFELYEAERKAAVMAEAIKAGCLTREIANMPDGGRSVLGEATLGRLQSYATERSRLPR